MRVLSLGIYKRKQESKKTRKRKKTRTFLDRFFGRVLVFSFSYFLVFFYKFPSLYCKRWVLNLNPHKPNKGTDIVTYRGVIRKTKKGSTRVILCHRKCKKKMKLPSLFLLSPSPFILLSFKGVDVGGGGEEKEDEEERGLEKERCGRMTIRFS